MLDTPWQKMSYILRPCARALRIWPRRACTNIRGQSASCSETQEKTVVLSPVEPIRGMPVETKLNGVHRRAHVTRTSVSSSILTSNLLHKVGVQKLIHVLCKPLLPSTISTTAAVDQIASSKSLIAIRSRQKSRARTRVRGTTVRRTYPSLSSASTTVASSSSWSSHSIQQSILNSL